MVNESKINEAWAYAVLTDISRDKSTPELESIVDGFNSISDIPSSDVIGKIRYAAADAVLYERRQRVQ